MVAGGVKKRTNESEGEFSRSAVAVDIAVMTIGGTE